jgi:hypothetical protein
MWKETTTIALDSYVMITRLTYFHVFLQNGSQTMGYNGIGYAEAATL